MASSSVMACDTFPLRASGTIAAVVVDKLGFRILQDATLAAVLASKVIYWRAIG